MGYFHISFPKHSQQFLCSIFVLADKMYLLFVIQRRCSLPFSEITAAASLQANRILISGGGKEGGGRYLLTSLDAPRKKKKIPYRLTSECFSAYLLISNTHGALQSGIRLSVCCFLLEGSCESENPREKRPQTPPG